MNSSRPARIPCMPETSTGGLRRSRARSEDVTRTTTAPSLTMQQSKRRSGATTSREARWSSRVIGFSHHRVRVPARVGAKGHRHLPEGVRRRPVERHVAPVGESGSGRRGGEAVGRVLRVGAPFLAHPLEVAGAAEDVPLAGEARDRDAGHDLLRAPPPPRAPPAAGPSSRSARASRSGSRSARRGRTPPRSGRSRARAASRGSPRARQLRFGRDRRLRGPRGTPPPRARAGSPGGGARSGSPRSPQSRPDRQSPSCRVPAVVDSMRPVSAVSGSGS